MPETPNADAPKPDRLLSLDVMRGATILAMILVNNPGDWGTLYAPLAHADWHGWTPTDLIFPFFLFMVGVAMAYSFAKYTKAGHTNGDGKPTRAVWLRIFRRVGLLILLGLALNASGRLIGVPLGYQAAWEWETLRWPHVLPRIGLAYLGASLLVLRLDWRGQLAAAFAVMLLYTIALTSLPINASPAERFGERDNLVREIDVAVLGKQHMWTQSTSRPTDPEGLLSTLPSIVTALIGYWTGRSLRGTNATATNLGKLLGIGLAIAAIGQAWGFLPIPNWGMPINKALWTPSFVLLSGGLAMVALACCLFVFDIAGKHSPAIQRIAAAFQMVGVNAIFVFVASGFVARAIGIVKIGDLSVKDWLYQNLFVGPLGAIGLSDPRLASVVYAMAFVGCWWLILWFMWLRNWSIRV